MRSSYRDYIILSDNILVDILIWRSGLSSPTSLSSPRAGYSIMVSDVARVISKVLVTEKNGKT
jgi:hypothetical protein